MSLLPPRLISPEPTAVDKPYSDEEMIRYLGQMARLGVINFTRSADSENVHVEMEIHLIGLVVLRTEAQLDAAGLRRLQGLMTAASLLEW